MTTMKTVYQMSRLLLQHVEAGKRAASSFSSLSSCCDGSPVNMLNLHAAAFALPNNVAWLACPQVTTRVR